MNFRRLSVIAFSAITVSVVPQARAAVTVLGNGVAHSCFEFAEFGGNLTDGVAT